MSSSMSAFDTLVFVLIILASLGVHRIWNYEKVTESTRWFLHKYAPFGLGYIATCPSCNAVWITAVVTGIALLLPSQATTVGLAIFASYPFLRLAVWAYQNEGVFTRTPQQRAFTQPVSVPTPTAQAGCTDCEAKKSAALIEQKRVLSFKKRVVLITALGDFHASYSVASCVLAQARMLAQDPTWLVQVWVNQTARDNLWPKDMPANVELRKIIPAVRFVSDVYDEKAGDLLYTTLMRELVALGNASVITHDLLFQASFLSFAAAIHRVGNLEGFQWWHQAHSGPSGTFLVGLPVLYRYSVPSGDHRILCLSPSQKKQFAVHYNTSESKIDVLPNSRDPRILLRASPEISAFISKHDLCDADIVQVYPFSTPRAWDKGVHKVIHIFGFLKQLGAKVRLVLPNAHANNNEAVLAELRQVAASCGLTTEEVVFTSEHFSKNLSAGLDEHDVQMLFQFANLFVFPTIGEGCSLVQMEAVMGGCLLVLNNEVPALFDVTPRSEVLHYSFGTSEDRGKPADAIRYDYMAAVIHDKLKESFTNQTKRSVLKTHSFDAIGARLRALLAG